MVISANGKSTRGGESPHAWASPEDQEFFRDLKQKFGVLIMGRKTYEAAGRPGGDGIRRIVLSRKAGFILPTDVDEALLVGGSEINGAFFAQKLIDDIFLTIEPIFFGDGLPLVQGLSDEVQLELLSMKQLNPDGTLLLHYNVIYH